MIKLKTLWAKIVWLGIFAFFSSCGGDDNGGEALDVYIAASVERGAVPLEVEFTTTVRSGKDPITFSWDFGDGTTSPEKDPVHVYNDAGRFTAVLTATDGNMQTLTRDLAIETALAHQVLDVDIAASVERGAVPLEVEFTTTVRSGKDPITFSWNFGDGTSSPDKDPVHVYNDAGRFTAVLTATDGNMQTLTRDLAIETALAPQVQVTAEPAEGVIPLEVNFSAAVIGGKAPYSYSWGFGDSITSTEPNPIHTYEEKGTFEVNLAVIDVWGLECVDQVSITTRFEAQTWILSIPGARAYSIIETRDGNFVVAGIYDPDPTDDDYGDIWVAKLGVEGGIQWQKRISGPRLDEANRVIEASDGGILVSGATFSFLDTDYGDVWLGKLNGDGDLLWQKVLGSPAGCDRLRPTYTSDGRLILAGEYDFRGMCEFPDIWILEMDQGGNILWEKTFRPWMDEDDGASHVVENKDGSLTVIGRTWNTPDNRLADMWIAKLDQENRVQWQRIVGGEQDDFPVDVMRKDNGNLVVVGVTKSGGTGWEHDEGWIVELDSDMNIVAEKMVVSEEGVADGIGWILNVGGSGMILVGWQVTALGRDIWMARTNDDYTVVWQKILDIAGADFPQSAIATSDGGIMIAGLAYDPERAFIAKLDGNGEVPGECNLIRNASSAVQQTTSSTTRDIDFPEANTGAVPQHVEASCSEIDAEPTFLCR